MKSSTCEICGGAISVKKRHNGMSACACCDYKEAVGFLRFAEFWRRFKVSSPEGIEMLDEIILDTRRIIHERGKECSSSMRYQAGK